MQTESITDERLGLPSASGAEKFYNCSGSPTAEASSPKQDESPEASEGTLIHAALETGDWSDLGLDALSITERLDQINKAAVEDWHIAFGLDPARTSMGKEERHWVYGQDGTTKIGSGKLDIFYVNGRHALIEDRKTGFLNVTSANRNAQLKVQMLSLWGTLPYLEHVRVAIAQCRFGAKYDPCDYTLLDMMRAQQEYLLAEWKSKQPDAPRHAGTWCRYCRAKGTCMEAAAFAMIPQLAVEPDRPLLLTKADALDRVNKMTVEQLAFVDSRSAITEGIFKAVKERLKSCDAEALASVGLMLGEPGKKRDADFQKLFDILFANKLTTLDEYRQWVSVTLGDLESTIIKRMAEARGITQKAAKGILATLTEPAITFSESARRLKALKE